MLPIKNLFGFRKNKELDKRIIQKNPYRNNTDLNKRQRILPKRITINHLTKT